MDERTPVLIGAGQFTYRGDPASSPSPTTLLKIAAERAAADAGIGAQGLAGIDTLAVVGFTIDAPGSKRGMIPHATNPPAARKACFASSESRHRADRHRRVNKSRATDARF